LDDLFVHWVGRALLCFLTQRLRLRGSGHGRENEEMGSTLVKCFYVYVTQYRNGFHVWSLAKARHRVGELPSFLHLKVEGAWALV
jgi:hypothetical protein